MVRCDSSRHATLLCCMLPFCRVPVVCAHVVSRIFPVPSTLSFLHAVLSFACQSLACMLLAVYSRCSLAMWLSCLSFVACKSLLSAAREERCLALPCLPLLGPLGLCAGASGKYLTRHLTPLSTCQHACMIHDPCLDCVLPLKTCELVVLFNPDPQPPGVPFGAETSGGSSLSLVTPGQEVSRIDIRV